MSSSYGEPVSVRRLLLRRQVILLVDRLGRQRERLERSEPRAELCVRNDVGVQLFVEEPPEADRLYARDVAGTGAEGHAAERLTDAVGVRQANVASDGGRRLRRGRLGERRK